MVVSVVVARRIAVSSLRYHQSKLPYVRISGLVGLNLQHPSTGKLALSSCNIFPLAGSGGSVERLTTYTPHLPQQLVSGI